MKYFVTGGAGFIGSSMVDRLLSNGEEVTIYDNLSTGEPEFIRVAQTNPRCSFIKGDILDSNTLGAAMKGHEFVMHFAANADVRFGLNHPYRDLEQNTIGTFNVLEAMRLNTIRKIVFSSTGSVYGEAITIPTPETAEFPIQTSLYGTSKLAGEGLISSYCEGFGMQSWIFRFVSILGERYTHGHVYDFYKKLTLNPAELLVLGNGKQKKSYLYIQDCLDGILLAVERSSEKVNLFNLGTDEYWEVKDSVGQICDYLDLRPVIKYTQEERGWIGDNPFIFLDCAKMRSLGWKPRLTIKEGIGKTLDYCKQNRWIFDRAT